MLSQIAIAFLEIECTISNQNAEIQGNRLSCVALLCQYHFYVFAVKYLQSGLASHSKFNINSWPRHAITLAIGFLPCAAIEYCLI